MNEGGINDDNTSDSSGSPEHEDYDNLKKDMKRAY